MELAERERIAKVVISGTFELSLLNHVPLLLTKLRLKEGQVVARGKEPPGCHPLETGILFFFFFFFFLFRAAPAAYGTSQGWDQIGVAAAGPHHSHSNTGSKPLQLCQILNPLSQARDRTRVLMDTSGAHNPLS